MFFQVSGIGPAFGRVGYFKRQAPEAVPPAIDRFEAEAQRTLAALEGLLAQLAFVAGDEFAIADITHFGWLWPREICRYRL